MSSYAFPTPMDNISADSIIRAYCVIKTAEDTTLPARDTLARKLLTLSFMFADFACDIASSPSLSPEEYRDIHTSSTKAMEGFTSFFIAALTELEESLDSESPPSTPMAAVPDLSQHQTSIGEEHHQLVNLIEERLKQLLEPSSHQALIDSLATSLSARLSGPLAMAVAEALKPPPKIPGDQDVPVAESSFSQSQESPQPRQRMPWEEEWEICGLSGFPGQPKKWQKGRVLKAEVSPFGRVNRNKSEVECLQCRLVEEHADRD
ncbi:uncharacterized protein BXZ73DRAFT_81940 [Epithele typhae]|uniref:uncharacterized protein n=1 Tax=Epithele typhae TaxID=378194 RepID=UPI0020076A0F|nr:uncharacterized protein BXZ73DRAFT_81940 [Epithele typhae]KAH9913480.1 hypothetical protein BXZ73DRAFT_81940 [Epithele typhae]